MYIESRRLENQDVSVVVMDQEETEISVALTCLYGEQTPLEPDEVASVQEAAPAQSENREVEESSSCMIESLSDALERYKSWREKVEG